MAVANTKSTIVTNADATVQTLNNSALSQGALYSSVATLEIAAADDDNSVYRLFRVHSSWRVLHCYVTCDAITGGTDFDFGLYQTAANGSAVVDQDCYCDTQSLATAITTLPVDVANKTRDIAVLGQQVWQDGAISADSNRWYDLCATGATVGSGAGTLTAHLVYTTNS